MGILKHFIDEYGFHPASDLFACDKCFENYDIKKYISDNSKNYKCSFCNRKTIKKPISIHINDFFIYLLECISSEWGDPNDEGVGWESKEGGWISARVINTWDLIFDELGIEINHKDLQELIVQTLTDREWCQKDPHGLPLDDDLFFSWQRFSHQIKHKSRFVFFKLNTYREFSPESDVIKEPYEILEYLGSLINNLDLLYTIPKDSEIFRARASQKGGKFNSVSDLGPPEIEHAKYSNRMSPAGIPMFYGSFDKKTPLEEISSNQHSKPALISLATFELLNDIRVIDLTKVQPTPSIFDSENRDVRFDLSFLNSFLSDFIKPIEKDGKEHIEYVPTQVVTEYFRYIFRDSKKDNVHGICYPSSRNNSGKSIVLFIEQKHCIDNNSKLNSLYKPLLFMDQNKTEYIKKIV